jgi:hypothetical protein
MWWHAPFPFLSALALLPHIALIFLSRTHKKKKKKKKKKRLLLLIEKQKSTEEWSSSAF